MASADFEIRLGGRPPRPTRLGLTALTDLVFILLLFFILETRFVVFHQLDFRQPQESQQDQAAGAGEQEGEPEPDVETLRLQVFADGRTWIAGEVVERGRLASYLKGRNPAPETLVVIAVEAAAPAQILVTALDAVHGTGLNKVLVRKFDPTND